MNEYSSVCCRVNIGLDPGIADLPLTTSARLEVEENSKYL